MRVQPARPSRPFTTMVTRSVGEASAAWSAAVRPAPPAPRIRTSVSRVAITARALLGDEPREERPALLRGPGLRAERLGDELAVAADQERRRRGGDLVRAAGVAVDVQKNRHAHGVLA